MLVRQQGTTAEADIHGMTGDEALRALQQALTRLSPNIRELVVVHGYHNGQVLRDTVRLRLRHPRIAAKLVSLNPGQTRIILR